MITKYDKQYMEFAKTVNLQINRNASNISDDQEKQVNEVFALENRFKKSLIDSSPEKLAGVYQMFINYIKKDVGNILSSQSYFRVKKTAFNKISRMIKNDDAKGLIEFPINYNLIKFLRDNWGSPLPEKAEKVYQKFAAARTRLIENNVPLAINRAKLFHRKTKENNLSLMDLIDICLIGLIVGIDKYSGAYTKSWRAVCIGRMIGFMIKEYSETFIKLYPSDRKILYRANKLKYGKDIDDINELTAALNESFQDDRKNGMAAPATPITAEAIQSLFNAAHYYSSDNRFHGIKEEDSQDEGGVSSYDFTPTGGTLHYGEDAIGYSFILTEDVSSQLEQIDTRHQLKLAIDRLEMIQKKIIKLKGTIL